MGLHGWSLWVVVGKINQSKSVPMMSLNVVRNIDQSNFIHLCGSPQVCMGGLPGSPQVVVGKMNQSKSVIMMSLNVVGNIHQSNFRCLCKSLWVVTMGLWVVSMGGLCRWSPWVSAGLCGWSLWVSVGGLHG